MRRVAVGLALLWFLTAYGVRLADMHRPGPRISALVGGQRTGRLITSEVNGARVQVPVRDYVATVAWIEGPRARPDQAGRLVVADVRLDGKLLNHAQAALPGGWNDCRLWLEEDAATVQAVARCPDRAPLRLSATGGYRAGLGPDDRPPHLYQVYPLENELYADVITQIHQRDRGPFHPVLLLLGALATLPLWLAARRTLRRARRLGDKPVLSGVMERTGTGGAGALTIRDGERRVAVFIEGGEMISVGLTAGAMSVGNGDGMVAEGLRASLQGEVEMTGGGAFRGQETARLRKGGLIVVGDAASEASRRLRRAALIDVGLAVSGLAVAASGALGLLL